MSKNVDGTDIVMRKLKEEVEDAKERIRHVLREEPSWDCPHCGHERTLGKPPWEGVLIKEAAQIPYNASVENIAFIQTETERYLRKEGYTYTFWPNKRLLGCRPPETHVICEYPEEVDWNEIGHHPDCFIDATFPC